MFRVQGSVVLVMEVVLVIEVALVVSVKVLLKWCWSGVEVVLVVVVFKVVLNLCQKYVRVLLKCCWSGGWSGVKVVLKRCSRGYQSCPRLPDTQQEERWTYDSGLQKSWSSHNTRNSVYILPIDANRNRHHFYTTLTPLLHHFYTTPAPLKWNIIQGNTYLCMISWNLHESEEY